MKLTRTANDVQPMQPVILVGDVVRFKANAIVRRIIDDGLVSLNTVGRWCLDPGASEAVPVEDAEQFWQLLGTSVCAYGDHALAPEGDASLVRPTSVAIADLEASYVLHPEDRPKPMSPERSRIVVQFVRETWRNDGAEGETVHALCDEVDALRANLRKLVCAWCGHENDRNDLTAVVEHLLTCEKRTEALTDGVRENAALRMCLEATLEHLENVGPCPGCSATSVRSTEHVEGCRVRATTKNARVALALKPVTAAR